MQDQQRHLDLGQKPDAGVDGVVLCRVPPPVPGCGDGVVEFHDRAGGDDRLPLLRRVAGARTQHLLFEPADQELLVPPAGAAVQMLSPDGQVQRRRHRHSGHHAARVLPQQLDGGVAPEGEAHDRGGRREFLDHGAQVLGLAAVVHAHRVVPGRAGATQIHPRHREARFQHALRRPTDVLGLRTSPQTVNQQHEGPVRPALVQEHRQPIPVPEVHQTHAGCRQVDPRRAQAGAHGLQVLVGPAATGGELLHVPNLAGLPCARQVLTPTCRGWHAGTACRVRNLATSEVQFTYSAKFRTRGVQQRHRG